MKNENIIKRYFAFELNECYAVKEFLEEMALKGWKLKKIKMSFIFEKIEPQELIYSVEACDKAPESSLENQTSESVDYYREAGWVFVCSTGKINVFVTEDRNVAPIETDNASKFKTIIKEMLKQNTIRWFVYPLLFLFNLSLQEFQNFITSNVSIFFLLSTVFFIIFSFGEIINLIIWCLMNKKRLSVGKPLIYLSRADLKKRSKLLPIPRALALFLTGWFSIITYLNGDLSIVAINLFFIGLLAAISIVSYFTEKGKRRSVSVAVPLALGFVVSIASVVVSIYLMFVTNSPQPEIPLNARDFGIQINKQVNSYYDLASSIFASKLSCDLEAGKYDISYTLYKSNYPFVINKILNSKINDPDGISSGFKKSDIPAWKAKSVYTPIGEFGETIVVYKNCIISYSTNFKLTDNSIRKIVKKINLR